MGTGSVVMSEMGSGASSMAAPPSSLSMGGLLVSTHAMASEAAKAVVVIDERDRPMPRHHSTGRGRCRRKL
jgi:hypothetical protein